MDYKLKDLIDIPKLQGLLDSLDAVYSLPSAIIDIEGNILTATAWQDICTMFHRKNPETEKECVESDSKIFKEIEKRPPHVIYKCPRGLVDTVTPIIIEGRHYGNAFTGQLFLERPDEKVFRDQARRFGFEEEDYIAAMRKVPVISEERLKQNLYIVANLAMMLAEFGLRQKRQLETEERIKASEKWFRELFEGAPDAIFIADADTGIITNANKQATTLTQKSTHELIGMNHLELHTKSTEDKARSTFDDHVHGPVRPAEHIIQRRDGTQVPVEILGHTFEVENKKVIMGTFRDITGRKIAEERLQNSLKEKEILLKEVHHRVKNNMAVISSLLSLQSTYVREEKYRTMIMESKSRIRSMALVHEKLYQSDNFVNIEVREYLQALVDSIRETFGPAEPVSIQMDIERIFLDIDTLIPCGLIINEILTNSFIHAFKGKDNPAIAIRMRGNGVEISLNISDNGPGLPVGTDLSSTKGLGLKLVKALTAQINGTVTVSNDNGARYHLLFPQKIDFAKG